MAGSKSVMGMGRFIPLARMHYIYVSFDLEITF